MGAQGLPWFRMYTDFLSDPKMISLAFEDQRHFIGILALKSGGELDQDCEEKLLDRIVAQRLWVDYAVIADVKKRLIDAGLIDDRWQPIAWAKRQRKSDNDVTGAERQRRFREEQKKRNALRNGEGNGTVTPPDKKRRDKSREEKKNIKKKIACPFDTNVPDDWIAEADTKQPNIDWQTEGERFVDSALANGRQYIDWKRAWWTWVNSPFEKTSCHRGRQANQSGAPTWL